MHIEFTLVSLLFRGTIFFLFVYKVYHVFIKNRLQAHLDEELQTIRNEHVEFVERDTLLSSTRKRLEQQLTQQKSSLSTLEKKYAGFVHAEQDRAHAEEEALRVRLAAIARKHEVQQENKARLAALQRAIDPACAKAHADLTAYYTQGASLKMLDAYIKKLA